MKIARVAPVNTERQFPTHLKWMKRAKCLRKGIENFWLAQSRPTHAEYGQVIETWCLPCPVRPECLLNAIRKETVDKHTSRGVEGGATPRERATLRRKIREADLCTVEGVWRWLHKRPLSRRSVPPDRRFTVTVTRDGVLVYRHAGNTAKGAHMIALRELRRHDQLVATVKSPDGTVIEVLHSRELPTKRVRSRKTPSPVQS